MFFRLFFTVFLCIHLFSCGDNLSELPEIGDAVQQTDAPVLGTDTESETPDIDLVCTAGTRPYNGRCVRSYLTAVLSEGYKVPYGGHLYSAEEEAFDTFREVILPQPIIGGPKSTDVLLTPEEDRLLIISRDGGDSVTAIAPDLSVLHTISNATGRYSNFHDAAYIAEKQSYVISANEEESLFYSTLQGEFSSAVDLAALIRMPEVKPAPSFMYKNGTDLFVELQLLGNDWLSRGGRLARIDTRDNSVSLITLPRPDPVNRMATNTTCCPGKLFVVCASSFTDRAGAIVRVDMQSGKNEIILSESAAAGDMRNVKFGDIAVTNQGELFFIALDADWRGRLYRLDTEGKLHVAEEEVLGFAANNLAYSPLTETLYYSVEQEDVITLYAYNTRTQQKRGIVIPFPPSALAVWIQPQQP